MESKGNLPRPYRIVSVESENENTKTWILDGRLDAHPGQFVMVWLPQIDEKPFSLANSDPITLTIARVGAFTTALHQLGPGHQLWLRGPIGTGYTLGEGPALLVGGGYGAAPLWFLARRARTAGQAVQVALGARTVDLLVLEQRFVDLGCEVHVATDDGSKGRRGVVTDLVAELLDANEAGALYGCGPEPMLHALETLAHQRGVPCQLSYEANMLCGMGVCGSCTHSDRLVCRDGPVFVVNG
jgi:dihydroorotate dehydrogenase electron transfer subunit